jgi:hypothetical protein
MLKNNNYFKWEMCVPVLGKGNETKITKLRNLG